MNKQKNNDPRQDHAKENKEMYIAPTLTVTEFKVEQGYSSSQPGIQAFTMDPFLNDPLLAPEGDEASHFGRTVFDWD